jgi:hypothetical protein
MDSPKRNAKTILPNRTQCSTFHPLDKTTEEKDTTRCVCKRHEKRKAEKSRKLRDIIFIHIFL